jgi:hypothetical protein
MGFKRLASYDVCNVSLRNPAKRGTDAALMVDQGSPVGVPSCPLFMYTDQIGALGGQYVRRLLGVVLAVILVIWGCTAVVKEVGREVGENRITILYSHFMSGYLEPCG